MASRTSRIEVLRGRPPGYTGIRGSTKAHCSSVRSLGYCWVRIPHSTGSDPPYRTDSKKGSTLDCRASRFEQFDMLLVPLDWSCLPIAWCSRAGRSPRLLRARLSDPPALNAIHYSASPERRVVRAGILQARCPLQLLLQD